MAFNKDIRSTPNDLIKSGSYNLENDPQLPNPFHKQQEKAKKILLPKTHKKGLLKPQVIMESPPTSLKK